MEKLGIPEDRRLESRLRDAAARNALGAAMVFSGHGDLAGAARFTAAAMECEDEGGGRPCGKCLACRKVLRDIHPDVITVVDNEHKNIAVEVLRHVAAAAYVVPNEGRRKIFIFPDCGLLEPRAQNALLKVLEEGPAYAAFLFCAENSAVLLPTIRSRVTEWRFAPGDDPHGTQNEEAIRLSELLCGGSAADLTAWCARLECGKTSREDLQSLLSSTRDLVTAGLAVCFGAAGDAVAKSLSRAGKERLAAAADTLTRLIRQCDYNVGVGHLAGALAAALK